MADYVILYWRDIPTQVIARAGRRNAKRELAPRFMEAVDMAAMRSGARDTDAYLADWRKSDPVSCGDDLEAEADAVLTKLEGEYGKDRLAALVKHGGREP
jgi:hypothetical protein